MATMFCMRVDADVRVAGTVGAFAAARKHGAAAGGVGGCGAGAEQRAAYLI